MYDISEFADMSRMTGRNIMPKNSTTRSQADAAALASALADPLRLSVLHRLMDGPASVAELTAIVGAQQSKVSNHLAVLRQRGLVKASRAGRQTIYALRDPTVAQLIEALISIAGTRSAPRLEGPIVTARTCYDHLAGRLGVALCRALIKRGAIAATKRAHADFALGVNATGVFGALGVRLTKPASIKRRYAYGCLDWTEREPHLGGWLGAQIAERALADNWVIRIPGSRAVALTSRGKRMFGRVVGI